MQNEYISKRMIFAFALRICAFFIPPGSYQCSVCTFSD